MTLSAPVDATMAIGKEPATHLGITIVEFACMLVKMPFLFHK